MMRTKKEQKSSTSRASNPDTAHAYTRVRRGRTEVRRVDARIVQTTLEYMGVANGADLIAAAEESYSGDAEFLAPKGCMLDTKPDRTGHTAKKFTSRSRRARYNVEETRTQALRHALQQRTTTVAV